MIKNRYGYYVELLGACLILVAVFLFYSYPLILNWQDQIIGLDTPFADTPQFVSNLYLFEKGWESGSLWHTQEIFYPIGASTLMHGFVPGMGLLFHFSGMETFAFLNTFILLCFVLGGLGAFQLAKRFNPGFFPALLVGFAYSFSCFHLAQWQDHSWYIINFTLPWYLLYFPSVFDFHPRHGLFRLNSWKALLICFVLGIISASLDYYTTFFLIYLSVFYMLWKRFLSRLTWSAALWKKIVLAFLLVFGCSLLIDVLRRVGWNDNHGFYWSGDLAGLFIPQNNRIYGSLFDNLTQGAWLQPGPDEKNLFLGFSFILALGYAKWLYWKKGRDKASNDLFLMSLLLLALCFPVLKLFGITLLKLPSALLHYIPFLNNIRVPTRWGILLYLFLSLYLVRVYFIHLSKRQNTILTLVLLLFLVLEYWPKPYAFFPSKDYTTTAELIKKQKGEVLLTIPFGARDGYRMIGEQDNQQLYAQTLHEKKLIGGYFSRLNDSVFSFYENDPLCGALFTLMENDTATLVEQNYSGFFEKFHPDLLYVRQDYLESAAFSLFREAARSNQVKLIQVGDQLWLLEHGP
ncbi:MAG TPA: hypothetical protein DIW47_05650 [Bacteroidetes bacterium]|nr:hypothetical protein [Bacteroidota bacterium]